ncbi:MAG: hypothetical protein AABW41_01210 [Nanoarchaeota archaeon]
MNNINIRHLISKKLEFMNLFTNILANFRIYLAANNEIGKEELSGAHSALEGFKVINRNLIKSFSSSRTIISLLNEEKIFLLRIDQEISRIWMIQEQGNFALLPSHLSEINSLFNGFIKKAEESTRLINSLIKQ